VKNEQVAHLLNTIADLLQLKNENAFNPSN